MRPFSLREPNFKQGLINVEPCKREKKGKTGFNLEPLLYVLKWVGVWVGLERMLFVGGVGDPPGGIKGPSGIPDEYHPLLLPPCAERVSPIILSSP